MASHCVVPVSKRKVSLGLGALHVVYLWGNGKYYRWYEWMKESPFLPCLQKCKTLPQPLGISHFLFLSMLLLVFPEIIENLLNSELELKKSSILTFLAVTFKFVEKHGKRETLFWSRYACSLGALLTACL